MTPFFTWYFSLADLVRSASRRQPRVEVSAVEEVPTKPGAELGSAQDGDGRHLLRRRSQANPKPGAQEEEERRERGGRGQ